jgi:hypothetical protein
MRPSQEEKLVEARQYFYRYQFRQAYHIYRQAFSSLPFQITQSQLDHIGHYMRVLLELDRMGELKFYLPILERNYEQSASPQIGYALAYVHYFTASKARARELFEAVRNNSGEDTDLRIKASMMLARLASSLVDTIHEIQAIDFPARDPHLVKLLEVWRCIILRYQGRVPDSIERLRALCASCDPVLDWYCILAAKDALIRGQLQIMDFDGARDEIEGLGESADWGKFRTVQMQMEELNQVYRQHLSARTIVGVEKKSALQLSHAGQSIRVNQPALRRLLGLFQVSPTMTIRKVTTSLSVSQAELREIARRLTDRLQELQLPKDSLDWQGIRLQLVPALRVAAET